MEGGVCHYSKFGFCKYKLYVKENSSLKSVMKTQNARKRALCQKRHPTSCKKYTLGKCRFKNDCAYLQESTSAVQDQCEVKDKVRFLENFVHELFHKILDMEEEIKTMKNQKSVQSKYNEDLKKTEIVRDNMSTSLDIIEELEDSKEEEGAEIEVFPEIDLSLISDTKEENKNKESEKESLKNNNYSDVFLYCDLCRYKCREGSVLEKHKNVKHVINNKALKCNECREDFNSLSDMLEHDQEKHQDKKFQNATSFVLSGSILEEFDVWNPRRGWLLLMS